MRLQRIVFVIMCMAVLWACTSRFLANYAGAHFESCRTVGGIPVQYLTQDLTGHAFKCEYVGIPTINEALWPNTRSQ